MDYDCKAAVSLRHRLRCAGFSLCRVMVVTKNGKYRMSLYRFTKHRENRLMNVSTTARAVGLALAFWGCTAQAATDEEVKALKAQLEQMQKTMEALQRKVNELETQPKPAQAAAAPSEPESRPVVATVEAQPASEYTPTVLPGSLSGNAAATVRPNAAVIDPENRGFIAIPGTTAAVRLGGYVKADAIVDLDDSGNRTQFLPSTIPTDGSNDRGTQTSLHAKQSRFSLELRRPTTTGSGNVRFLLENDFFSDSDTLSPSYRLRHVYAQVDNALVGYSYSTYIDADALPDTVDFAGPNGQSYLTTTQFRYIYPFGNASSFSVAIEKPESQIVQPAFACLNSSDCAIDTIPDIPFALRTDGDWGHIQWSGVIRSLGYDDGHNDDKVMGWGTSLAGIVKTFGDDSIQYQVQYGNGIGRYITDLDGNNVDAIAKPNGDLEAIKAYGGYAAYQHYWNSEWRSTFSYGYVRVDDDGVIEDAANAGFLDPASTFKSSKYASANLIWNLYGPLNVGLEYLWGYHEQQNGDDGDTNRIQLGAQINFLP